MNPDVGVPEWPQRTTTDMTWAIGLRPYEQRHLAENAFERTKRWRGLATRHRKWLSSFIAAVQIRCASLWLHIV